jgi:hypothetical protein
MIRIRYVSVKEAGEEIDGASGEALDQAHPFVASAPGGRRLALPRVRARVRDGARAGFSAGL